MRSHVGPIAAIMVWATGAACGQAPDATDTGTDDVVDTSDQAGEWPSEWVAYEDEVLRLVNLNRSVQQVCGGSARAATGQLTFNAQLRDAARTHSRDMAERGFFDHRSPWGDQPSDRALDAGYPTPYVGENIAAGQSTPDAVMDSWMRSPGHCNNITEGSYVALGVGLYVSDEGQPYWTQVFGTVP